MKEETHSLKCVYKGIMPYIKVTAYELSAVNCSADKMSGYYGEEGVLISDDPAPGYNFKDWSVTGTTLTGNNFKFNGDVTAQANYSAIKYNVTLQNDGHGSIAASKTTGNIGDTIILSNTANAGYNFSGYSVTGATLTGNQFKINTSNVTAKAWFTGAVYTLTLQNDGHGTLTANKTTGHYGDTVTLTPTYNNYYRFNNYSNTGGSINGNTFTFGSSNATVKANFKKNAITAVGNYASNTVSDYGTEVTASSYPVITGLTGSLPASWGSINNRFQPTNASGYWCRLTAAAEITGSTEQKYKNADLYLMTGSTVLGSGYAAGGGSNIWDVSYSNSFVYTANAWYIKARAYNYSRMSFTIRNFHGSWSATAYAP